jgi:hypothetical protein
LVCQNDHWYLVCQNYQPNTNDNFDIPNTNDNCTPCAISTCISPLMLWVRILIRARSTT